ncbi:MAG: dockerin type I domain-containing protein [Sedimentisphaerales bacterium]
MKSYLKILFSVLLTGLMTSCFAEEVQLESFDNFAVSGWYDTRGTGLVEQAVIPAPVTEGTGSMRIHFENRPAGVWDVVPRKLYPGKINLAPIADKALSFWVWSDLAGSSRVVQLIIYQDEVSKTARFAVPPASETGWRKVICPISEFFYYPPDGDVPVDDFSQIDAIDFWCSAWPSGGNSIYIDDLQIISDSQYTLPRVEEMSNEPSPYLMRDWHKVTEGYVDYVLDNTKTGSYLPLSSWITSGPWAGMFNMSSYVGRNIESSEAINALALIVSGTLAGYDMSNYNGHDPVTGAANMYYCASQQMCGNNGGGCGNTEFWYKMLPAIFMVQIADLYPDKGGLPNKVNAIANKLYNASVVMGGKKDPWTIPNYNHYSFNFSTMQPIDNGQWVESDSAAAFAWISYMAYTKSGDSNHLTAADWGMSYLSDVVPIDQNPHYEVMLQYGPITAARMNAELGRSYDLDKLLYWCSGYVTHLDTYSYRVGWGMISSSAWGGYDCDGLVGSVTDGSGYAFAMNTFQSAGATIPVVRYNSSYARTIGKWMLNLANAARLFYPSYLDANHQYYNAWNWAISQGYDPNSYIAYEGLRRYKVENGVMDTSVSPYATGDNALRLGLYGSSSVGYLGGIVRTTNVEKILQWDCLKTDFYHDTAYPTYLYFNPYDTPKTVSIDAGSDCVDLYDTVSQTFLKTDTSGITDFNIPADSAVVIVLAPAGGTVTIEDNKKLINGVVVDYSTNLSFTSCAEITASPQRLKGDLDGDCLVGMIDLQMFVDKWLSNSSGQCANADINRDGDINFDDFAIIAADWLQSFSF